MHCMRCDGAGFYFFTSSESHLSNVHMTSAGKLKELGNTVLGKFGMSLDNFKAVQDPATGSYSINFQQ